MTRQAQRLSRLDAGEPLDLEEQRTLLGSLVELDRTVRLPAEFHIRVHREGDGTRWSAQHPLLRLGATALHPADALVRAAVELRRVLQGEFGWPGEEGVTDPEQDEAEEVPESTWETLSRTDPAPETVVGVVETRHRWTDDIPATGRRWPWTGPRRFPAGRWVALEHSWRNDDHWAGDPKHLRLIAQPLQATPAAELALRRLADTIRSGESVGVHAAYHEAASRLLPGVSVRNVRGWISPAALPLDVSSVDDLVADLPDLTGGDVWADQFTLFWLSDPSAADR